MISENLMHRFSEPVKKLWPITATLFLLMLLPVMTGCDSYLVKFYFGDTFSKGSSSSVEKSAEQLAVDGMQKMQKQDYDDAVKDFQ